MNFKDFCFFLKRRFRPMILDRNEYNGGITKEKINQFFRKLTGCAPLSRYLGRIFLWRCFCERRNLQSCFRLHSKLFTFERIFWSFLRFQGCAYYSPSLHAKCNTNQKWSVLEWTSVCISKRKRAMAKCELFIRSWVLIFNVW